MRILAVDVGTGTQDVLLFDTEKEPENALKLVMPAPTVIVSRAIRAATTRREAVILTGVTMGGGPCGWAAEDHLKAGLPLYATPEAARTFNDDLAEVAALGVTVVSDDEAAQLEAPTRIALRDLDYAALSQAFALFGVDLGGLDLLSVAVFDHGAAPPGISDRLFRFGYLAERIKTGQGLAAFAFAGDSVPAAMTRLRSAAASAPAGTPLVVMDTAPAAVLGALQDPAVRSHRDLVVANLGNLHTLAFHLRDGEIAGLVEHHTGCLDRPRMEALFRKLADGTLSNQEVFDDHGHGALIVDARPSEVESLVVLGPRRALLAGSEMRPYPATPFGDMMMAGCWGLVRAAASIMPWAGPAIEGAIGLP